MTSATDRRSTMPSAAMTVEEVAAMIDHSLLRPELTTADVHEGCALAARYGVASVCVRPADVPLAVRALDGTGVAVGTVIGFPHGGTATTIKAAEAATALAEGARELDMVLSIGRLRSGDEAYVLADIRAIVDHAAGALVKVILENAYLTTGQKVQACRLTEEAGADFVKTSTGFAPTGATLDDLRLMRQNVSAGIGVKAAGGVRTLDTLLQMADAGANRFGATATAQILDDLAHRTTG
jgi:deoxyribose-phosphate aldolase